MLALLGACAQSARAVVQLPFSRQGSPSHDVAKGGLKPRALSREFFLGAMTYVVNATVGTPGQPVSLVLSPSSSDTWVVDARSGDCTYYNYYYGSTGDDLDDYYYEVSDLCLWGSCK